MSAASATERSKAHRAAGIRKETSIINMASPENSAPVTNSSRRW